MRSATFVVRFRVGFGRGGAIAMIGVIFLLLIYGCSL
jgi:hypothetical protein